MKFYKILHIPTGLFYIPVRGRFSDDKTNLSKKGKVYTTKPSLEHISHGYNKVVYVPEKPEGHWDIPVQKGPNKGLYKTSQFFKFVPVEWAIIEFEVG